MAKQSRKITGHAPASKGSQPRTIAELRREWACSKSASHWVATVLASEYLIADQPKRAKKWSDRAFAIVPECPLVLFDRARVWWTLGDPGTASKALDRILELARSNKAVDGCWESHSWKASIVHDCEYFLGDCHMASHDPREAAKHFKKFLSASASGRSSMYSTARARRKLKWCEQLDALHIAARQRYFAWKRVESLIAKLNAAKP